MARLYLLCYFFFQAEDGIRDYKVTGVQTCALPIWGQRAPSSRWADGYGSGGRRLHRRGGPGRGGEVHAGALARGAARRRGTPGDGGTAARRAGRGGGGAPGSAPVSPREVAGRGARPVFRAPGR